MKYCLTAHILYIRITEQTHLIELIPHFQGHNKTVSGIDDIKYTTALTENKFLHDKCRNSDSLQAGRPGIELRWGPDFPHPSRPSLGPIQPPIQWVQSLFPGGKAAGAWRWPPTPD
jgi:hypothetical protein